MNPVVHQHPLLTHVVGARPNFPKASPVIKALAQKGFKQRLVHTGQHYDDAMSDSFFRDLDIPKPDVNLGVGSGSHAQQTAALMIALELELTENNPTLLVVYGDINSTLAASVVAAKLGIDLAHVEAGLRSFDRSMPEEINRIVTDRLADLLFTTSPEAKENLLLEGVEQENIYFVGNPMIDSLLSHLDLLKGQRIRSDQSVGNTYAVVTLHRPGNVDDLSSLSELVTALKEAALQIPLIIPLHPRGRQALADRGLMDLENIVVIDPLGYLDFISLIQGSRVVITDSGGVQEETTILGIPCLTLRPNTERPITISQGTNQLVSTATLNQSLTAVLAVPLTDWKLPAPPLWDGRAGERIATAIQERLKQS